MYSYLLRLLGPRWAHLLTLVWYVVLIVLVVLTFTVPAAEFRYGNM